MIEPTDNPINNEDQDIESNDLSLDEIEAAYLRAMEVTDSLLPEMEIEEEPNPEDAPMDSGTPDSHSSAETEQAEEEAETVQQQQVTSRQVIEALLFVGSDPLPAKKILEILGGSTTHEQVDVLIEELNETYRSQYRPYHIQLVEGGYRMSLKSEFEPVRRRVYGQGPKEIKLNQETLEVLAFVAYQQPASRTRLNELGKKNVGGLLRQLLRRQLIQLDRNDEEKSESYTTTKRFLDLFGLGSIDDLPQAMDFNFK